MPKIELCVLHW